MREHFGGSYRAIPDEMITITDGRTFHIGPDCIYWPIYMGLEFEPEATSIVRKLVRPGDKVVDAGANYGWYTTLFAQLAGRSGHVYAFEPVPTTHQRLVEHIQLNDLEDCVTALSSALGTERGKAAIHIFESLSHSRSSLSRLEEDSFKTIHVPIVDLDTYLETQGENKIDFLKCDVEGSELLVFKGAHKLLKSDDAPSILVELNGETSEAFGYKVADLWIFLKENGYDHFYEISSKNNIRRVESQSKVENLALLLACKGDQIEKRMAMPRASKPLAA